MMESIPCIHYLRKVFPEIDLLNVDYQKILRSQLDHESKVQKILSLYFKTKAARHASQLQQRALRIEARYINKLFPTQKFEYIREQLEIFKDLNNRREIVLRMILHNKNLADQKTTATIVTKRTITEGQFLDNINNNEPVNKVPKLDLVTYDETISQVVEDSALSTTSQESQPADTGEILHVAPAIPPLSFQNPGIYNEPKSKMNPDKTMFVKPHTVTSSSYNDENSNLEDIAMPVSEVRPFTCNSTTTTNYDYEVPDIMEHFFLSVVNFPLTQNSSVTSTNNVAPMEFLEPLPVASNVTIETSEAPVMLSRTYEFLPQENISDSVIHLVNRAEEQEAVDNIQLMKTEEFEVKHEPRDSQDSNKTEIYSPDMDIMSGNGSNFNVDVKSPTYKEIHDSIVQLNDDIKCSVQVRKDIFQDMDILSGNGSNYNVDVKSPTYKEIHDSIVQPNDDTKCSVQVRRDIFQEVVTVPPSPRTEEVRAVAGNTVRFSGDDEYDLVQYIQEITNASTKTVKKYCKRLNLPINKKPTINSLNILVDNILTVNVDSEESDVETVIVPENVPANNELPTRDMPVENSNENATFNNQIEAPEQNQPEVIKSPEVTDSNSNVDMQLVNNLCSIFPDACPNYIKKLCRGKMMNNEVMDDLITVILDANSQYPKRPKPEPEPEVLPENQLEILREFLPDADPDYLRMMCDQCEGKPDKLKVFLSEATEKKNYPTMKDYQRRQQLSAQQKQYTTEFNVENFIKLIPDPHAFFADPSRKLKLNAGDSHYVLVFMRNKFNKLPIRTIQSTFTSKGCSIAQTIKTLEYAMTQSSLVMKGTRRPIELPKAIENIPLLQELAYYTHEKEINQYLKQKKEKEDAERLEAANKGLLKTCSCCYDEEVLPRDIYTCENGCEFCQACIVKSSEVRFGEGKLDFPCLMNCESSFSLQTLQAVLSPKLFSKVAQKKALEEIKSAGIDELEMCPFCDFATIPAEGYNIFTCLNPECMKESCRMCKEPSHIPLRCDEIEKDEDVRARTFVENKMTEALLRKCWKCGVKFFKEEGCNKMTCSCGAQMCYVCGKPVTDYKHFNGNGGDRYDLCPLYSDTNVLNKENVLRGAEQAKAEIGNVNLKHDPTTDLNQHYQERRRLYPQDHLLAGQPLPVHHHQLIPQHNPIRELHRQLAQNRLNANERRRRRGRDVVLRMFELIEQRRLE